MSNLGRRTPTDWRHTEGYPLRTLIEDPAHALVVPPDGTERGLGLPTYWNLWDQGSEGACVGFGSSAMMGITNTLQSRTSGAGQTYRYAPRWLYSEAQLVDEWGDTPPAQGTSVRASCDVLRTQGHRRVRYGVTQPVDLAHGIQSNRWALTTDEIRAAIYAGLAVSIGVNWYSNFDSPVIVNNERWIGQGSLGGIRGGHCVCIYRMSDRRQAFRFMNSWGSGYPPVWLPYDVMQRLLGEDGEATVITDR